MSTQCIMSVVVLRLGHTRRRCGSSVAVCFSLLLHAEYPSAAVNPYASPSPDEGEVVIELSSLAGPCSACDTCPTPLLFKHPQSTMTTGAVDVAEGVDRMMMMMMMMMTGLEILRRRMVGCNDACLLPAAAVTGCSHDIMSQSRARTHACCAASPAGHVGGWGSPAKDPGSGERANNPLPQAFTALCP
jgi:hypothetical protein